MHKTHIDRMAQDQARVDEFVKTMDDVAETLNQDVVDDPEDLFVPMAELADLWPTVRSRLVK